MSITIKDIAKKAGVSITTVSLVLNCKPCRASETTKARIKEIADKYNFVANQSARSLVTKKTHIIGMIIPDIENIFFASLCKSVEQFLRKHNYSLIIVNSNDMLQNDLSLINVMIARGVDGLLFIPSNEAVLNSKKIIKKLETISIPFVLVDRKIEELNCDSVCYDNRLGAIMAVDLLIKQGHKKIGCISGPNDLKHSLSRLDGYIDAFKKHKLAIDKTLIKHGDYKIKSGYDKAEELIKQNVTAIFVGNDMMTLGALRYLHNNNLKVPDDCSIISYDDTLSNYVLDIGISSVRQDTEKLAIIACQQLLNKIGGNSDIEQILLKPELIERDSVKSKYITL